MNPAPRHPRTCRSPASTAPSGFPECGYVADGPKIPGAAPRRARLRPRYRVAGNLQLVGNTALTNLNGLTCVGGALTTLYIRSNTALGSLDGLEGITYVGYTDASYYEYYPLMIRDNTSLTTVTGLNGLTSLGYGYHDFRGNTALCGTYVAALKTLIGASDILGIWYSSGNKAC